MKSFWIAVVLGSAAACGAQSSLPATSPTASAPVAPIAATPAVVHGRRAQVTYQNGLLQVRADNSSLNVILRQIVSLTGMKVSGGVADQRVFGNYGPDTPGTVLATLLDGTGVNLLLLQTPDGNLTSLTLSPRQAGGVTPPGPESHEFDEEANAASPVAPPAPPRPAPAAPTSTVSTPPSAPQPWNNVNGSSSNTSPSVSTLPTTNSVPLDSITTPSTTPSSTGIVDAPNPPPPGSTTPPPTTDATSPNGVKTPEQIYQQLLDLQKRRAAAQAAAGASGNSTTTTTAPQP